MRKSIAGLDVIAWRQQPTSSGTAIKCHNVVCKVTGGGLRDLGWAVEEEPHYNTSMDLQKPDLVAKRQDRVVVMPRSSAVHMT